MPETIGLIVLEAVGLSEFSLLTIIGATTVASVTGTVILVAGSIGLQLLLNRSRAGAQPGSPALPGPESGHQPLRQAIPPRIVGYGRVRLAGSYVLFEANASISYDVAALHHGRISGFIGYYLHDDVVTIDGAGIVDVQGDGRYGSNKLKIKTRLGAATETAYSEITTPLATIWTAAHRGDGLASLALICDTTATVEDFATIYPRGKPEPSAVCDCTPIFDSRDPAQVRATESTHLVSSNGVLQLIDFLTSSDRGMGFDWDVLIAPVLDELMHEADLCDEQVERADGAFEPRYASNGSFPLDSDPADVINTILDTMDGWLSENGAGALVLKVGVFRNPSLVIESKHIRGVALQYDVPDEEAVNELTIDYTEAQLDYKTAPGSPWRNETDISERGKTLSQRFAVPWVYSHAQARRLAKRRDAQNNATLRGTITTTLYGLRALSERWIKIEAPDLPDLGDLVIENRGVTIDLANAQCTIKFISVNPNAIDAWDPDVEEGSAPTIPSKLIAPAPPVPQNINAESYRFPTWIKVSCDDPGRSDLSFLAAWRINGSGDPFTNGPITVPVMEAGRPTIYTGQGVTVGVTYEVKLRSFAPAGAGSAFSTTDTVLITV